MKQYSYKRNIQILAHILKQYGINHIVLSPGSRNAPISIHFSEDDFNCYSIVDERSAAFVGIGMAKSLHNPVALSSTSGSAVVNYYPAVVEAFYQNVPLLILTADRPEEYIDIFDGQTIHQNSLFQRHSYGDFQMKEDNELDSDEYNFEIVRKAVELCIYKKGPVHINIPLIEPLYETVSDLFPMPEIDKYVIDNNFELPSNVVSEWNLSKRVMILLGTLDPSPELNLLLEQFAKNQSAIVLTEVNSNQYHPKFFNHIDRYIFNFTDEDFKKYKPDLLITVGQNVVSKKVKQFLRKEKPVYHWHVDPHWHPDTYFSLTKKISTDYETFFSKLIRRVNLEPNAYFNLWDTRRDKIDAKHEEYITQVEFSDFMIFRDLVDFIPENYSVHFSNSSAIRYAQLFNYSEKYQVYCNRGVSGIDGCTSTAMGFAMMDKNPVVLITGDLSFFYDINGLWNKYIPPCTRIIIVNNGEGNIFRIIPGTENTNAIGEYIATSHKMNAYNLAKHFKFDYFQLENKEEIHNYLEFFFKPSIYPKILEFNTKEKNNADILKEYFKFLKV